ncbi:MAG: GspH/FimT family pseudopilin [Rhodocyclales bacterium]|nr:GspH/FimT family pseudopilin [Rhodocyclales bacterium]
MIAVALLAVLMTLAGPSWLDLLRNNRLATETNDVISELALARSESARRGYRVSICPSSNGTSCAGTDFAAGRIVFEDRDADGVVDAGTDEILRVGQALSSGNTLKVEKEDTAAVFTSATYLQYRPSGVPASLSYRLTLCDSRGLSSGRGLAVTTTGRVQLTKSPAAPYACT